MIALVFSLMDNFNVLAIQKKYAVPALNYGFLAVLNRSTSKCIVNLRCSLRQGMEDLTCLP